MYKHLDRVEEVKDGDMYTRHPTGLLVKTGIDYLDFPMSVAAISFQARPVKQAVLSLEAVTCGCLPSAPTIPGLP